MSEAAGRRGSKAVLGWMAALAGLALAMPACQERLTAPGECPELCPGGNARVFDTVLTPVVGRDSSATGYVARGGGAALLTSNGLPASEDRAFYRFQPLDDSISVRDTLRGYTVDSARISLNLVARDTLMDGLKLLLYRIPPTVDLNTTFAEIDGAMTPANLIDSIAVADALNAGPLALNLLGADVDKVSIPPGTGGILALAVGVRAVGPTGVRLASLNAAVAGTAATLTRYLTLDVPDTATAIRKQTRTSNTALNNFVTQTPLVADPNFLTIGGEPSSRAFIPFELPVGIADSATIARATLELIPATPLLGLPTDPPALEARAILADLGPKSPLTDVLGADTISVGTSDTVRVDVTSIVQLWQNSPDRPRTVVLTLLPEGASFTRAVFGSTRSPTVGPPRLRITYMLSFPFENP